MTERTYKVGDVVAWADVPDGAMVRDAQGWHALRLRERGIYVGKPGEEWLSANPWPDAGRWHWSRMAAETHATIVALGLTGQESAGDLQRLAEVFEVREAVTNRWGADLADELSERLHAAGWRPGMSADDAARLLAEAAR